MLLYVVAAESRQVDSWSITAKIMRASTPDLSAVCRMALRIVSGVP